MMTDAEKREKVIKGLECCATNRLRREDCEAMDCVYLDLESHGCIHQLIRDALALLKEQEPVKPIERNGFYYCGACRYAFTIHRQKYCTKCGRAVKWE